VKELLYRSLDKKFKIIWDECGEKMEISSKECEKKTIN
jgi:hypothetical protein